MTKFSMLALCALPCTFLTACDPEGTESEEGDEQEFGAALDGEDAEPRCAVNGSHHFSAPLVGSGQGPLFSATMEKSSPSTSYSSASCGDYYVIEATNVDSFWSLPYLLVDSFWAGPALSQAQCAWTIIDYDISIFYDGAWHQRTRSYDVGTWDGTKCKIGDRIQVYDPNVEAEKVQVAVRAKYLDGTGEHYGKVGAAVTKTNVVLQVQ